MCDLGEIVVCDSDESSFWTMDAFNEDMESTGEINGQMRKIAVLSTTDKFIPAISQTPLHGRSLCKRTTHLVPRDHVLFPFDASGTVEARLRVNWGGKDDTKVSGGVKVELKDEKGNYASVLVEQNSDGEGSAEISAGHKEEQ